MITATIVSSLLFSLLHGADDGIFETPLPFINLLAVGVLLALMRQVTGGLWMPIGVHLSWNYFQGTVYGFSVSGAGMESVLHLQQQARPVLSGGVFGAEGSIVVTVLIICAILLFAIKNTRGNKGGVSFTR